MEIVALKVQVAREAFDKLEQDVVKLQNVELRFKVVGLDQIDKNLGTVVKAQAKLEQANASIIKSEAAYAIQTEKTAQAVQKTAQAEIKLATEHEKTSQAEAKAATQAEKTAQAQANLAAQTEKTTKASSDLFTMLGTNLAFRIQRNLVREFTQSLKEALDTMKAVDDQLVTVRKVTGATADEIAQIREQSYQTAAAYGAEADAYLESVAAFARAGYKEKSAELAELSTKTQVVGDTTAAVANQFLLAVDAAYKYEGSVENLGRVLDGANEIDNNYATSIEKIAEGLGKIAPLASQTHVGIDQLSAALGTITAVTQRSGTEAATALRAIFLNIIGDTTTEVEDGVTWTIGEIEGLRDVIRKYAPDAYKAAEATGAVIDPMEAIGGLAKSMKEGVLTEQELVDMVSDIGGKLRSTQLLALVQNWDMYKSMLADFADSVGSADKEVENAMDSWTRKAATLDDKWAQFVSHLIDTDTIKGALDVASVAVDGLDTGVGRFAATVGTATTAILLLKGAIEGIKASESGAAFLSAILNPTSLGILAATAAVVGLVAALKKVVEVNDANNRSASEFTQEIEENTSKLDDNKKRLEEISKIPWADRSPEIIAEYDALVKENEELERQNELLIDRRRKAAESSVETAEYAFSDQVMSVGGTYDYAKLSNDSDAIGLGEGINSAMMQGVTAVEMLLQMFPQLGDEIEDNGEKLNGLNAAYKRLSDMGYSISLVDVPVILSGDEAIKRFADDIAALNRGLATGKISQEEFASGIETVKQESGNVIDNLQFLATTDYELSDAQERLIELFAIAEGKMESYAETAEEAADSEENVGNESEKAENKLRGFVDTLFDANGKLTDVAQAALQTSDDLRELALAQAEAQLKAEQANYDNLISQIEEVGYQAAISSGQLSTMMAMAGISSMSTGDLVTYVERYNNKNGTSLSPQEYVAMVGRQKLQQAQNRVNEITKTQPSSSGGSSSAGRTYSERDKLESQLSLMQNRGDSVESQISVIRQIQDALHDEAQSMRQSGKSQVEINNLSAEWWNWENKITELLEEQKETLTSEADVADQLADARKKQLEIEERILAVREAQEALENAKRQRTVRVYNASSGQWEWVADARAVESAQEALENAQNNLLGSTGDSTGIGGLSYGQLSGMVGDAASIGGKISGKDLVQMILSGMPEHEPYTWMDKLSDAERLAELRMEKDYFGAGQISGLSGKELVQYISDFSEKAKTGLYDYLDEAEQILQKVAERDKEIRAGNGKNGARLMGGATLDMSMLEPYYDELKQMGADLNALVQVSDSGQITYSEEVLKLVQKYGREGILDDHANGIVGLQDFSKNWEFASTMGLKELGYDKESGRWAFNGYLIKTIDEWIGKISDLDQEIQSALESGLYAKAEALSKSRGAAYYHVFQNGMDTDSSYSTSWGGNFDISKDGKRLTQDPLYGTGTGNIYGTGTLKFSVEDIINRLDRVAEYQEGGAQSEKDLRSYLFAADELRLAREQGMRPMSVNMDGTTTAWSVYGVYDKDREGRTRIFDPDKDYTAAMLRASSETDFYELLGLREAKVGHLQRTGAYEKLGIARPEYFTDEEIEQMLEKNKNRWEAEAEQKRANEEEIRALREQLDQMNEQNSSLDEKISKLKEINGFYEKQKKFLEDIGAEQSEINALEDEHAEYQQEFDDLNGKKSKKNALVKVQANGRAQAGLDIGTRVVTAGGTYEITGIKADGSYESKLVDKNKTTGNTDESEYTFDAGGILSGIGGIKATMRDEMVLPPDITEKMLSPASDTRFRKKMEELWYLYGDGPYGNGFSGMVDNRIGTQVNGGMYQYGDIRLTEQQAKSMTLFDLAQAARTLGIYNSRN